MVQLGLSEDLHLYSEPCILHYFSSAPCLRYQLPIYPDANSKSIKFLFIFLNRRPRAATAQK